ncbi:hypothetical protein CSC67_12550 [Pusillimonas caeni]|uniref:DUF6776 family protein n=1 Tax=Pusillimonas caeni TaxID=1348472 RepID=UPI000E59F659|nr:DUF6776 family protein [Pusillimonas caeni]TFL13350.1 hypothetical protein CSC67_12550 [Pusillimonas caeni]
MNQAQTGQDTPPGPAAGRRRSGWIWVWLLLAALAGGGAGYWAASTVGEETAAIRYRQLKSQFELVTAQNRHDYQALQTRLDALQGQMLVEESTRRSLEAALQSTQAELGRARDQLAFFDRLLPPGPNGSVSIRALDFEHRGPTLLYKVLLMRNAPGADAFAGQMQFVAKGRLNGEAATLTLEPATAPAAEDAATDVSDAGSPALEQTPLALEFEQFQRSEGLLSLPEGFEPSSVTLNVLEGKTLRVSRTVNLPPGE